MNVRVTLFIAVLLFVPLICCWDMYVGENVLVEGRYGYRNSIGVFQARHVSRYDNLKDANVSEVPIVKVVLSNGSCLNFSSVDDVLYMVYNGTVSISDIQQINMSDIDSYLGYIDAIKNNESANLTYIPSRKMFFSKLESSINEYNGSIVPVSEIDYVYDKYGPKFSRHILYGSITKFEVYDFGNNRTLDILSDLDYDLYIVAYFNGSDNYTVQNALENINVIIGNNSNVAVVFVDVSNSANITEYNTTSNILFTYDNKTRIDNGTFTGTFVEFITKDNFSLSLPLIIVMDENGWIWWKDFGFDSASELSKYVSMYIEKGMQSMPVYPILDIAPIKPHADEPCDVYVIIGQGFGEILDIKLSYEILNANNETIKRSSTPLDVDLSTLSCEIEKLDKDARWLTINASIVSEFGEYKSDKYVFRVEYSKPPEKTIPEIFWQILFVVSVLIVVIVVGTKLYRKYFK
ncbi:MAG: hypothetical protein Q6363_003960 [Candidatus Njordarchaeota archaeon]